MHKHLRGNLLAVVVASVAMALAGCGGNSGSKAKETAAPPLTYVAFGDSWPYGAHCNGCTPFPELYAKGLESQTGQPVKFNNLTENGGTAASLASDVSKVPTIRDAVTGADVIMISTGGNDMEPAFGKWQHGSCGGSDGIKCFETVAQQWHDSIDAVLTQIDQLRAGKATAVRVVTMSNEFLADPGLIDLFGKEFGLKQGAKIVAMQKQAMCDAAKAHHAVCVDLRPVLNGPDFTKARDVNTQDAMQRVADALLATGTPELGKS